jgi:hypothetical protein
MRRGRDGQFLRRVDQAERERIGRRQQIVGGAAGLPDNARRRRRRDGVQAGIARIGLHRVAAHLVEEFDRIALGVPVAEPALGRVAQIPRHALLIDRPARLDADDAHQFVDNQRVGIGGQRLAVAFGQLVFGETGLRQLHDDRIGDLIAGALGKGVLQMDDGIFVGADQRTDRGIFQRFRFEDAGPEFYRKGVVLREIGGGHAAP